MKCRIFHKYGRWRRIIVQYPDGRGDAIQRECRRCGFVERRSV